MLRILVLAVLLMAACSSGEGAVGDAGVYYLDGGPSGERDLLRSFVLTIPEGAHLCSGFDEGRFWREELAMLSQMELAPGTYVLDRKQGEFRTGGFIKRVLFSPEKIEALPKRDAGRLEVRYRRYDIWGVYYHDWYYGFTIPMRIDGKNAEGEFYVKFMTDTEEFPAEYSIVEGHPWMFLGGQFRIAPGEDYKTEIQGFVGCDSPRPPAREVTATGANGDVIKLTLKEGYFSQSCGTMGHTQCLFLTGAEVKIGEYQEVVADRWRLVYIGSHHNWRDKYLILLDPPAGDVHAVMAIAEFEYPLMEDIRPEFVYLDADLEELRRETEVVWEQEDNPMWEP